MLVRRPHSRACMRARVLRSRTRRCPPCGCLICGLLLRAQARCSGMGPPPWDPLLVDLQLVDPPLEYVDRVWTR